MSVQKQFIDTIAQRRQIARGIGACASGAILLAGLAGCSGSSVAKVGNVAITEHQFVDTAVKSGSATPILTNLLLMEVVQQEAKAKGVSPTDADVAKLLSDAVKANPAAQKEIDQDRAQVTQTVRTELALKNLMAQGTDMSDAKKKAWFNSHHTLFDQPATYSAYPYVFDNADTAKKGRDLLLVQHSTPASVVKLGSSSFAQNGQATPPAPKDQFVQMFGPANAAYVQPLTAPTAKVGSTTDVIPNLLNNKPGFITLAAITPAKTAKYEDSVDKVERFMGVETYAQKNLHIQVPPNTPAAQYNYLAQTASQNYIKELMASYMDKKKITISDPKLHDAIAAQFKPPPAAAAGGLGGPGGPMPAPGGMEGPPPGMPESP